MPALLQFENSKRMPTCRRCKSTGSSNTWGRYAPTKRNPAGLLHELCPACDEVAEKRRVAVAQAHARGYESVANTPEYKRMQAERAAKARGRVLGAYIPRAERKRRAAQLRAELTADRIRRHHFRALLQEWNRILLRDPNIQDEIREKQAAKSRQYYHQNLEQSRRKTAIYKATHTERTTQHHEMRADRIKAMDDGTLTTGVVRQLKAQASRCAYCDAAFLFAGEKQTDHMVALCHGGEHSRRNIVIVCRRCNSRKARLTYAEWLDRIEPAHRWRAVALFNQRYGIRTQEHPDSRMDTLVNLVAIGTTRVPVVATFGA